MTTHFRCNFLIQEISFFLWYWALIFYRHMVGLSVFELTSYTSLRNLTWKELMAYGTSVLLLGLYLWNPRRIVDYTSMTGHYHQSWGKDYTCQPTFFYGSLTLYLLKIPPWSKQPAPLAATLLCDDDTRRLHAHTHTCRLVWQQTKSLRHFTDGS